MPDTTTATAASVVPTAPATKTITSPITLVTTDDANSVPFKYDALGRTIQGFLSQVHNPPGTPVTLPAREAEAVLARFGGQELDPETGEVIRTVPTPAFGTRPDTRA